MLTYAHHDVDGMCTFVVPLSGIKQWVVVCPKTQLSRSDLAKYLTNVTDPDQLTSYFLDKMHMETVHLSAGDLM